jgi:hypothetical protein
MRYYAFHFYIFYNYYGWTLELTWLSEGNGYHATTHYRLVGTYDTHKEALGVCQWKLGNESVEELVNS